MRMMSENPLTIPVMDMPNLENPALGNVPVFCMAINVMQVAAQKKMRLRVAHHDHRNHVSNMVNVRR